MNIPERALRGSRFHRANAARATAALADDSVAGASSQTDTGSKWQGARTLFVFVIFQFACQLALLSERFTALRPLLRGAAFASSIGLFALLRGKKAHHPVATLAYVILGLIGLSFFHPLTNGVMSGLAQVAMYVAILAPILWVPRLAFSVKDLRRFLTLLWSFHSASAVVGALQVYFPGRFQPATATVLDDDYLQSLQITLANGERIFRPMGLTDTPGGAGVAGLYAVLLGAGLLLGRPKFWQTIPLIGGMLAGAFALYLSQVRAAAIMLFICLAVIGALLAMRGKIGRLALATAIVGTVGVVAFVLAAQQGGSDSLARISNVFTGNARQLYYTNRGFFLEETLTELLPRYPLGAGLGRWGMMAAYFGDFSDITRAPIHVEIQWTGWLVDGGIPLVFLYAAAMGVATVYAFRVAFEAFDDTNSELTGFAILIVGYNVGAFAMTFNYALFMGNMGLEFWLLNGALFAARQGLSRQRAAPSSAAAAV